MFELKLKFKKKRNWQTSVFLFCMMAIPFFFGVIFDIYMKLQTVSFMFRDETGTKFGFFYINWAFEQLVTPTSGVFYALKHFFLIFLFFNFVCMPLQVGMSYFFVKKIPGTMFYRIIFYAPNLISQVITAIVFRTMMDSTYGPVTEILRVVGVQVPTLGWFNAPDTAFPALMFYYLWISFGTSTMIYTAAINKLPPEIFEAGRLDGVSMWRELIYIVFPMISPILSVGFLSNTTAGFNIYAEVLLFTDPSLSNLYTVAYLITEGARKRDYYHAAGIGFVFTLIAVPIVSGLRWAFDKFLPDVSY